MQYKGRMGDIARVAKELGVRYVVDGTVQKQGKSVKITSQLIDAQTGKTLLSNDFDGTTDNLFDLEGRLARSIAFELQGSLVHRQLIDSMMIRQGTKNPEAYNKFILGIGYLDKPQTKEQAGKGLSYILEALRIDPHFAIAQCVHAFYYLYRYQYTNGAYPHDLVVADSLAKITLALDSSIVDAHFARALIARASGNLDTALHEASLIVAMHPDNYEAQSFIGGIYYQRGQFDLAAQFFEKAVQKNITALTSWSMAIDCFGAIGDTAKQNKYINESLPLYQLYLEKNPADVSTRTHYALSLAHSHLKERAHEQIAMILKATQIGPTDYYNMGCIYSILGEAKPAIAMLKKSFETGYKADESLNTDPDLANIRSLPEFKGLIKQYAVTKQR